MGTKADLFWRDASPSRNMTWTSGYARLAWSPTQFAETPAARSASAFRSFDHHARLLR
jgi:hypothetical protein